MQQPDLLRVFISPLERSGLMYMVTGSVASTMYGEPRMTHDIDLVLMLKIADIRQFRSFFPPKAFYCPPPEVIQIELKRDVRAHFNLIHHDTGYKADCYPFTGDPLHRWAFGRLRRIKCDSDLEISIAPPEYVILRKLQFFLEGGSEKHIEDIKKMISQNITLDTEELHFWIHKLQLKKAWEQCGE